MSNADRTIWQFPKNVAGKVPGWRSDGKGLENKDWADPATKQDASANLTTLAAVTPGSKGLAILADTNSEAVHNELARDWSGENLFTFSQELDNAAWTKTRLTVTANATAAPDGTLTADKLVEDSATGWRNINQSSSFVSGSTYTYSAFVKEGERRYAQLHFSSTAFGGTNSLNAAVFDAQTGTIAVQGSGLTGAGIESHGNGWYRIWISKAATSTTTSAMAILTLLNSAAISFTGYAGDGASGIYVWGEQIEAKAYPTNYTKTTSSARTALSAPSLSLPNIMQRRYVDIGAYCSLTDTNDAHAAIQAAFDDANGREIVFTNPYGGTRYYRSLTRPSGASATTGALTMPRKARIIMESGALLDFSDWANSGNVKYYLYASATAPTAVNLASNAANKATTIVLTDGSSFAAGDDIIIVSDAFFTTEDGSVGTKGEWAFVTGVSSNTLTIAGRLRDTYNTADAARVYRMSDLCELTLEGINLLGCGRFSTDTSGDRGIWIEHGKNCHILGGSVSYSDQLSISLVNILNGSVVGTSVRFGPKVSDAVNQYGPHFTNMCENVHFRGIDVLGGKEASGLTATGGIQGVTRDCSITSSRFRGAWRSGCATHDTHTGFEFSRNVVEDCEQGVDNRIIGGTYKGNIFRRMGAFSATLDCALQLGSGAQKVLFEGNTVEDALRGVFMSANTTHETTPGDIDIINNDMRGMRGHGVRIEYTTGATDALGTITVNGLRLTADGSAATIGVEAEGKWKVVVDDLELRGGNGGQSVFLHATANGTGTNGPVNPVLTEVKYDSTFLAPDVRHSSGLMTAVGNREIGDTAPSAITLTSFGVATAPVLPLYTITSNSGVADDFDSIIAMAAGSRVTYMATSGHTITVRNNGGGTGNIRTKSGASVTMSGNVMVTFICDGTIWYEE